jgi:hypothetical protein
VSDICWQKCQNSLVFTEEGKKVGEIAMRGWRNSYEEAEAGNSARNIG